MNLSEMIAFAKLFTAAIQGERHISISSAELDLACEALKKAADQRSDWTLEQQEIYKLMVDYAKEQAKSSHSN